ncbi:MAG TPA: isoprenylcysteine carboxylmethyltransferase family protein [Nitrospiria bacterium]|nr:isoprenylcysteine carboxylmethyltransferase family protein [Nitrospiria bacterium]
MIKSIRHFIGYHRILLSIMAGIAIYIFAKPTHLSILAGLPVILAGEGIRIWSSGYITKNKVLVQDGPYALVRHPLYFGNLLIGLGFTIMAGKVSLLALFLAAFAIIYFSTIAEEEEFLQNRFGYEFSEYAQQVPRFIPWATATPTGEERFKWERVKGHKEYKAWVAIGLCLVLMVFKSYYVA